MCLLAVQLAIAGVITQEEAQEKAAAFMAKRHAAGIANPLQRHALRLAATGAQLSVALAQPSYYVFNVGDQQGFVVVSGDDRTPAILGYADQGLFDNDNIPDNMRSWLQGYADQLRYLNSHPDAAVAKVVLDEHASIAPLLTSTWSQSNPYNLFCPEDDGKRSFTGCVATAMAQVINYYKHPAQTTAEIPAYVTKTKEISVASIGITTIDWDNILDHYTGDETTEQKNAVAKLMQLCGSAMQMDYSAIGSGAYSAKVPDALKAYFDYDASTRHADRSSYRAKEWDNLVYQELAGQHPVYYHGTSTGGGHAFVIDGYDKDGLYHVNWGWGGNSNNYFLLSILDSDNNEGPGASSSADGYSYSQGAVIGARPNTGEPYDEVNMSIDGISPEETVVNLEDDAFLVWAKIDGMYSRAANTHTFDMGLGIFDNDGQLIYAQHNSGKGGEIAPTWGYSWVWLGANIPALPDGKYQITAVVRESGTETWSRCINGNLQFLTATVSGTTMTLQAPVIDLSSKMVVIGNRQFNTDHTVSTTIQNNGTLFAYELFLFVDGERVAGRNFEVDAGETETIDIIYTPTTIGKKQFQIGYYSWYRDESDKWQQEFHLLASASATFGIEPTNVYSVAGAPAEFFGSYWDEVNSETEMSRVSDYTFVWKKEYVDLTAGDMEFKVVVNHSWDESYPASNYVLNIPQDDTYNISIYFNEESKDVWTTVERVNTLADAQAFAADDDAVAVGKLRKALEEALASGDQSKLGEAVEQFKADNADMEKDETAKVDTDGWKKFEGDEPAGVCAEQFAPKIITYDGRYVNLAENYEETTATTGQIIYQDITGLTNGTYKVGFYGNAFFTSGRGFSSPMAEGADDVAYVFANEKKEFITAHIATATTENDFREFDVEVTDGTIKLGMGKEKAGTNWHTMQIFRLTWFVTAKALFAANQAELLAVIAKANTLMADETRPNGKDKLSVAIAAAQQGVGSNWYNNDEIEQMIADLKNAIVAFRLANFYTGIAYGTYYIADAETGKMMAAGHNYGTRGIVNEKGLDMIITTYQEYSCVSINSRVNNGDNNQFLGNNLYMDSQEWGWYLESQDDGFHITDGKQFINIDADDNLVMSDTPRKWNIVSVESVMQARLAKLAEATAENPVDATFLIKANDFNRNDLRNAEAWIISDDCTNHNLSGGNEENNNAESWHSTFTISQAISGAPAGIYKLTAQGFYRQDDDAEEDVPVFFIGNKTADVLSIGTLPDHSGDGRQGMDDASVEFTKGNYTIEPIEVKYYGNGDLVIGIKGTATHQWVCFDNFQLTYCGPFEVDYYVAGGYNTTEGNQEDIIFGTSWDPTINKMTLMEDGTYTFVKEKVDLTAGTTIYYKVVEDGSWDNHVWGFGEDNADYIVGADANYDVVITFNPNETVDPTGQYYLTCNLLQGGTTGISTIAAETDKAKLFYNLNGQRVVKAQKGLYIVNGKKQVVR